MSGQPIYTDAAILIALTWGGGSEAVLAATDHINAGYAVYDAWVHACALLGKLGLLACGEPLPSPTPAGVEVVRRYCPSGTAPRAGAMKIRDVLSTLPVLAEPIGAPNPNVIAEAIAACEQR